MPKKYAEEVVQTPASTASKYERAHRVELEYPLHGRPAVIYITSEVHVDGNGVETQGEFKRRLSSLYTPGEQFDVYDANGNVTGTSDHDTLMALLHSFFFSVANKEDA